MGTDSIVFHGSLRDLLGKVETGEMIPKLEASHAPMDKFCGSRRSEHDPR